jgi:hypothetical protein
LRVAAIGVLRGDEERALIRKAGVDAIIIDTAHGHTQGCNTLKVKAKFPK